MSSEFLPANVPPGYGYPAEASHAPAAWQPPPPAPADPDGGGLQIGRYLAAVKRYKWLILALFVVGTATGIVVTRFIDPQYQATASVWLGVGGRSGGGAGGPVQGTDPQQDAQNWMRLLTSKTVLNTIVEKRLLYVEPSAPSDSVAFTGFKIGDGFRPGSFELRLDDKNSRYALVGFEDPSDTTSGSIIESGAIGDSIGRRVGFLWQPTAQQLAGFDRVTFSVNTPASAVAALKGRMNARVDPRSSVAEVTLTGNDRYEVAATLNALVTEFVATADEVNASNQYQVINRLRHQADSANELLLQSEKSLEQLRIRNITKPNESTGIPAGNGGIVNPAMQDFYATRTQLEDVQRQRKSLERILGDIHNGQISVVAFQAVPTANIPNSPLQLALQDLSTREGNLRALLLKYTDEHPAVISERRYIATLRDEQIPRLTQNLIVELEKREAVYAGQLQQAGRELQAMPSRTIAEQQLQRDVNAHAGVYTQLLEALENARIRVLSEKQPISVLDTASVPYKPVTDSSLIIMLLASIGGLALGVASAIGLDLMDSRFRYPEQATRDFGLSIIGGVPRIAKDSTSDPEEQAQVVEAFRTIRMNLRYALQENGDAGTATMLAVSSPGPGDGKSLVSANIAVSFAEAGYRTLLIDGDTRRGQLHESFGQVIPRRPGLIDYLTGMVPLDSVIRETGVDNLSLVPCGTRRHRGPELLQSQMLTSFLESMKTRYDVVIVDTPPLAAGIDPFVLGTAAGNMILVFRTGETDRKLAEARLGLVQRLPINLLGVVLNDIQAHGAYRYYSYLYGYSLDEDEGGAPALAGSVSE
jgi:capsular exopolysaccharide synthesis family protein